MNSVVLIGRLTKDPQVRYTSGSQMAVASFTLAIDRPVRNGGERQADFPRIVVFGRQAETCEKYLAKGRLVAVSGRIQTGSYQNQKGDTVYTTDVVANRVEFLEWGDRQGSGSGQNYRQGGNDGYSGGYNGGYQNQNAGGYGGGYGQGQQAPSYSAPQQGQSAPQAQNQPAQNDQADDMPDSFEAIDEDVPF
ncbi:MAG: single-stranded DNA-binding protein [Eubacterium sp.]|jgi:single-strand DNA-binding protein|nr:single-stranded DNA-binding protein [Eubacterium sp.]MCH4046896.1 single-stranded DNA-binding protein [Eubacterium sp.]MCH4079993.1 single-stranded DNA-binding protein [Eubacterium sp.]MCH4109965.1 single-stranded DNA-binding protein [Eubacterium sp.]MCI1307535.1 single-stranded DNA-binding protein [Eubacterium sp.]